MGDAERYAKTILCLANSRRPGGVCFAGREISNGKFGDWIRPINKDNQGAISTRDRLYKDNTSAELLDIVTVHFSQPKPHLHHTEDHQIRSDLYWQKVGRATWNQVVSATEAYEGPLWSDGDSSYHGLNDKVSEQIASTLSGSLLLIAPTRLDLVVAKESAFQGPDVRRVRAAFDINGTSYNFVVTDPVTEAAYFAKENGTYRIENARLCVSLAEVFNGSATKLVASVITPDRV